MRARPHELVVDAAAESLARALALLARTRRGKPVHPRGVVYRAVASFDGAHLSRFGPSLLTARAEHPAIVRFSRSAGLPPPIPDALGMAIRLPDVHGSGRHQDILLVSSPDLPILHHLLVAVNDPQRTAYSSMFPYTAGRARFLIGARPSPGSPRADRGTTQERLEWAAETRRLRFDLGVARMSGRLRRIGVLRIGQRLPDSFDSIAFDPWNTGGGLEPAGALNRLRRPAYRRSQAEREAR